MKQEICKNCIHKNVCANVDSGADQCRSHVSAAGFSEYLAKRLKKSITDVFNAIIEFKKMKGGEW